MNFLSLKNEVADWLNRPALANKAGTFINMAILNLERENDYQHMIKSLTGTTAVGDKTITIPTGYKKMLQGGFKVVNGSVINTLDRKSEDMVDRLYPRDSDSGTPQIFCVTYDDLNFKFGPKADSAYPYSVKYYKFSDALAIDNGENWWLTNAWDLTLWGALLQSAPYLKKDDRLATWKVMFDNCFKSVVKYQIEEELSGSSPFGTSSYVMDKNPQYNNEATSIPYGGV